MEIKGCNIYTQRRNVQRFTNVGGGRIIELLTIHNHLCLGDNSLAFSALFRSRKVLYV